MNHSCFGTKCCVTKKGQRDEVHVVKMHIIRWNCRETRDDRIKSKCICVNASKRIFAESNMK